MTGWCQYKAGTLQEQECHFDGHCRECQEYPDNKGDLISRQAVLDKAHAYGNGYEPDGFCVDVEDIQALPTAQPEQRWILCSDRLPDVRHNVLITDGNHTAEGQLRDNGDWVQYRWTCLRKHDEIIAWQPLPEPYKET